jgi:hypothetical protein
VQLGQVEIDVERQTGGIAHVPCRLPRAQQWTAIQYVGLDFLHHPFGHPPGLSMTFFCQPVFLVG